MKQFIEEMEEYNNKNLYIPHGSDETKLSYGYGLS